jgi:hypothetical protein
MSGEGGVKRVHQRSATVCRLGGQLMRLSIPLQALWPCLAAAHVLHSIGTDSASAVAHANNSNK